MLATDWLTAPLHYPCEGTAFLKTSHEVFHVKVTFTFTEEVLPLPRKSSMAKNVFTPHEDLFAQSVPSLASSGVGLWTFVQFNSSSYKQLNYTPGGKSALVLLILAFPNRIGTGVIFPSSLLQIPCNLNTCWETNWSWLKHHRGPQGLKVCGGGHLCSRKSCFKKNLNLRMLQNERQDYFNHHHHLKSNKRI